jgi:hypothetical protein
MAPTSVLAKTSGDSGAMAMPTPAIVDAIDTSAADDSMSKGLGRIDHRCWRVRFMYVVA